MLYSPRAVSIVRKWQDAFRSSQLATLGMRGRGYTLGYESVQHHKA